jgi:2-C-methyl-D-erythritol 4-phosphate cytidylyltransferase
VAVALIVAAGRGERLGSDRPKALVTLGGRTMLEWSVEALRSVPGVERIVVALPADALAEAPEGTLAVAGGAVRSASVREALRACPDGDPVVVHDAARPLAPARLFSRAIERLEASGADAVVAAAPVSDTIKEVSDGHTVTRTLDRSRLWAVQTPQVFRREALKRALMGASDSVLAGATDDAWLVEQAGGVVEVVESSPANLKITTPTDLTLAELLLAEARV